MGQKIDDQDYEEYKVKVPKHDKDGNDITGDKLGKGGRHRGDGTFSGMAYDFQPLEESNDEKIREDLESKLKMLAYDEKTSEIREGQSALDTINDIFNTINNIMELLEEHPEIIEGAIKVGKKVKYGVIKGRDKVIELVHKRNGKLESTRISNAMDNQMSSSSKIVKTLDNNITKCLDNANTESDSSTQKNMNIAEARELVIGILTDYISMKKSYISMREKMDRLSNVNVDNIFISRLDVNQIIIKMDTLIKNYPALMDDSTSDSVLTLLRLNRDEIENRKIKEVLRINVSSIEDDYTDQLPEN